MRKEVVRGSLTDEYSKIDSYRDYSRCKYTWGGVVVGGKIITKSSVYEDYVQGLKVKVLAVDTCDK